MKILSIETSCDETAAAIVEDGTNVLASSVASSTEIHRKWGGIVPEVAAREQLKSIVPVLTETLESAGLTIQSIDAIAVTVGPGLIGSLLVGVETAKTLAFVTGKQLIPVNHVIAHTYANFIHPKPLATSYQRPSFPAISLVASGGHTELYFMESEKKMKWLGGTIDDAAGEAFDKTARLLGFENRGGPAIEQAALNYQLPITTHHLRLPRPYLPDQPYNFSFSGLKTAILREVQKLKESNRYNNEAIEQLAFEVQEAITDVLVRKTINAAQQFQAKSILLSGGVAANKRLRQKFVLQPTAYNLQLVVPPSQLCTDNAVTIGSCAYFLGKPTDWHTIEAQPNLSVEL